MGILSEITDEYLGSLKYVREIPREFSIPLASPDIIAILGPRRVGKTFFMLKKVKELVDSGEQALYAPMDEPLLRRTEAREFAEMVRSEFPEGKVHLFLDEVQDWPDWGRKLRWLHDVKDFYLCISGSSSALQYSEIPTQLRGRYLSRVMLPLSLRELVGSEPSTFRERGRVRSTLEDYIRWGGFPEVWVMRSREKIVSLVETIFYRDIVERHRIRNMTEFREVFYHLISNYSNPVTWNSLRRALKGQGVEVDTKTVMSYASHMMEAFLLFTVGRFSHSERVRRVSPRKVYLVDVSIANLFDYPMDLGRRMENLVYLELLRAGEGQVSYYVTRTGREVDFLVWKPGSRSLIEVAFQAGEEHLRKMREACRELKLDRATLVTWEGEGEVEVGGCLVREVPLWRFLSERGPILR